MHVAILHYSAPPIIGGVEVVIRAHAKLLLAAGHKVTILAGRGSSFDRRARMQRIALLDSMHPDILAIAAELAKGNVNDRFFRAESAIRGELKRHLADADVVMVHNALTLHKNMPLTAAVWHMHEDGVHTPIVAWCHDVAWTNPQYLPVLHDGEPWTLLKRPIPGAYYVSVSQDRAHQLTQLWGENVASLRVIPNGIDAPSFLRLSSLTQRLAARLRLLEQDLVLLLPARLTRRKNIELAIRITASLVARGIAVRVVVTGPPGPHNVANRRYAQELGHLRRSLGVEQSAVLLYLERDGRGRPLRPSDRVVADLYALSDGLLFPSKQEGFGIPILEAGLSRIPVFCADIEPLRELAEGGHYFPPDSSPDIVADMIEDWMRRDAAYKLRKRVLRRYSWQAIYHDEIEPLLTEVKQNSR